MPANLGSTKKVSKQKKVINIDKKSEEVKKITQSFDSEELIFALDIGTRTVVGVVGVQEKEKFRVLAAEYVEHTNRAMLDGQIHDINQVAEVAKTVKEKLEKKAGITLTKVAIAAAGRVLKTSEVKVEREIEQGIEISRELVGSIEMEAIQKAQSILNEKLAEDEKTEYYCVGYSIINYYLNGYVISSLLGHRGKKIGADVLATFLPHIVVDSLYTVMSKIGLEVISLTLEPIAAINVTIPKDLRLLNLALVDIGAGTSDIAITRDGSVVAYAMVPLAGDEITEKIAQHYLVDFNSAERIKILLSSSQESISFTDILGMKHSISVEDILELVKPSINLLAETIAKRIIEYNHKSPNAVFLIGGGSQIPGLTDKVSEYLKLPKDRVVVRGREIIQNIKFSGKKLSGPEAITPFGIAVTAQMQKNQDFMAITVNGKKVRLFNSKKLTVSDALVLIGFNPSQLIGRTGKSISFELNGVSKVIRGEFGKPAEIFVNDIPSSLNTVLNVGDNIIVISAEDGKNAEINISDFVENIGAGKVFFNNAPIEIGTKIFVNGSLVTSDIQLNDGDKVQVNEIRTVNDLLRFSEIDGGDFEVFVNGQMFGSNHALKDSDIIECRTKIDIKHVEQAESFEYIPKGIKPEHSTENLISKTHDTNEEIDLVADEEDESVTFIVNGKRIKVDGEKKQYIFIDIFNFIDFDLSRPKGNVVLKLNGKSAGFTDVLNLGDVIDIYWEKAY